MEVEDRGCHLEEEQKTRSDHYESFVRIEQGTLRPSGGNWHLIFGLGLIYSLPPIREPEPTGRLINQPVSVRPDHLKQLRQRCPESVSSTPR